MKTELTVTLTAQEVTNLLVPAVMARVNPDSKLGTLVPGSAKAKDIAGLEAAVSLTFESEATA
jgi:hypothetical protein